jgi:hypothetical protein
MKEVHSEMERDGPGTLELEVVLVLEDIGNLPRVPSDNGQIINVHSNVFIRIAIWMHPDVRFGLGRSKSHVIAMVDQRTK